MRMNFTSTTNSFKSSIFVDVDDNTLDIEEGEKKYK